jgi:NADPH2:quinone reductase
MAEEASIIGCALFRSTPVCFCFLFCLFKMKFETKMNFLFICVLQEEWVETAAAVVSGLDVGFLTPFVDKEYPMENVQEAHANVLSHEGGSRGKLVLKI